MNFKSLMLVPVLAVCSIATGNVDTARADRYAAVTCEAKKLYLSVSELNARIQRSLPTYSLYRTPYVIVAASRWEAATVDLLKKLQCGASIDEIKCAVREVTLYGERTAIAIADDCDLRNDPRIRCLLADADQSLALVNDLLCKCQGSVVAVPNFPPVVPPWVQPGNNGPAGFFPGVPTPFDMGIPRPQHKSRSRDNGIDNRNQGTRFQANRPDLDRRGFDSRSGFDGRAQFVPSGAVDQFGAPRGSSNDIGREIATMIMSRWMQ